MENNQEQEVDLRIRLAQLEEHSEVNEEIAEMRVAIARLDERSLAAAKAVETANTVTQQHFDQINSLNERMRQQHLEVVAGTKQFVTLREHEALMQRIEQMNDWRQNISGREQTIRVFWIVGAFLAGLALEWMKTH